jgi:hypothetical protein
MGLALRLYPRGPDGGGRQGKEGLLFLKKKKQKDFYSFWVCGLRRRTKNNEQKFFGSFFQKRTTLSFPACVHRPVG